MDFWIKGWMTELTVDEFLVLDEGKKLKNIDKKKRKCGQSLKKCNANYKR